MTREFQFYIIPTPIGNIKDITLRAIEILKSVDYIACEDSRVTQKLLNHYDIKTKTISYHKFNETERVSSILKILSEGKKVALVSDAGTPLICDPGSILIEKLRENNISITSLTGSNAVSTFLSQVPRKTEEYVFTGFLPRTENGIEELCNKFKYVNMVFYESPNRILKSLEIIAKFRPDVKVSVGRELTKVFEEIIIDDIKNVINHFKDGVKGEIIAMLYASEDNEIDKLKEKSEILKKKGFKSREIVEILTSLYDNVSKNDVKSILY